MGKRRRDTSEESDDLRRLTSELEAAVAAERKAREELSRAQGQLAQSARLAALGQLVVGVAHEINNPLAFVINNTAVLQRDTRALSEILRLYHDACAAGPPCPAELIGEIRAREERIDIEYTLGPSNRSSPARATGCAASSASCRTSAASPVWKRAVRAR